MKNHLQLMILSLCIALGSTAQIAVNTDGSSPDNSAMLDVKSTAKGFLAPRMTQAQRLSISNPATGLMVFQTDGAIGLYSNNGTPSAPAWSLVGTGSGLWSNNGSNIYYNSGNVGIGTSTPSALLEVSGDVKINSFTFGRGNQYIASNTAAGQSVLFSNTTGYANTGAGFYALYFNSTGYSNSAYGSNSLYNNSTGIGNTSMGSGSLTENTTGNYNTATGVTTLYWNLTGNRNTAIGFSSLYGNTTGSNNTANGYYSLYWSLSGRSNVAIGAYSLFSNESGNYNVAVGDSALYTTSASGNTAIGSKAMFSNTTGTSNTSTGYQSLYSNAGGSSNTANGHLSLYSNSSGNNNTAVGVQSLYANSNGISNTALGYLSLTANTTGGSNTAAGSQALVNNQSGASNAAFGRYTLYYDVSSSYNTAIGYSAGDFYANGSFNTFLGFSANASTSSLSNATGVGYNADVDASNKVRIGNTAVTSIGGQVGWTTFSDGRYKRNVQDNIPGLAFIQKLKPVSYTVDISALNNHYPKPALHEGQDEPEQMDISEQENIRYSGFVAQDVEKAALEVGYDFSGIDKPQKEGNLYGLRYGDFVVPLVKAVQELNADNNSQKLKLEAQQKIIANQQAQIDELKQMVLELIQNSK